MKWLVLVSGHIGFLGRAALFMFVSVLMWRALGGNDDSQNKNKNTISNALTQLTVRLPQQLPKGHPTCSQDQKLACYPAACWSKHKCCSNQISTGATACLQCTTLCAPDTRLLTFEH